MTTIYKTEKIEKKYKVGNSYHKVLKDVDITINKGDIVVILGPSGSGKSTLLNLLSGIDQISSGKIWFEESRLDQLNELELTQYRADHLGFIFQSYNLVSNLTVKENIELGSHLSKNPFTIKEMLDVVGLGDHQHKFPYQLSGGQMQRVAIARALVKNPDVLFCDEPTGALDEKNGKKVLEMIAKINKEYQTTMIIVTHNPSIAQMANMVIRMNSGEVVAIDYNKETKAAKDLRWA